MLLTATAEDTLAPWQGVLFLLFVALVVVFVALWPRR